LIIALSGHLCIDAASCPPFLNILFEDEGVIIKLYNSGRALVHGNTKEDVEHVCSELALIIEESNYSNKVEM
jgi:hypothetical protein